MKKKLSNFLETQTKFLLRNIFYTVLFLYSILLIWLVATDYEQTIKKVKENNSKTSTITSLQVRSTFEQVRNILIIISSELNENTSRLASKENLNNYLYSRNMLISDIENLLISNNMGRIIASSTMIKGADTIDINNFKKYKKNASDQFINPDQRKSSVSGEWSISFIHKNYDSRKAFKGITEAIMPLNLWYSYLRKQMIYPNDEIDIIHLDTCSIIGTSSKVNNVFKSNYLSPNFCATNLSERLLSETYTDKKSHDIISYVTLPEFRIAIITISSPHDFMTNFYKKNLSILMASLLIIIIFWQLIRYQLIIEEKLRLERIQIINSSKMASLGEMAGGIAHEINTPLAIINMSVEELIENADENHLTAEDAKTLLQDIKSTSDRIAKIISGLRFFSRDGSALPMTESDLDSILVDTLSFCSEKMQLHNVKLEVIKNYNSGGLTLNCRPVEISQVLLNLLNNANDAIALQEDKWIKIVVNDLAAEVEISIIDSGLGIPHEVADKIMQPFFTTKEVGKGTGLGLSISRGIIESHKGKIMIDKASKNTKFTITIPKN